MHFLAIIGGGPAGYTAAELASKAGKDVLLFEQTALGGTCLNVGCIPTKTLLYSAKQYFNAAQADKYGVAVGQLSFDYQKMVLRKQKVVRKLTAGIRQKLQNEHCTVINGQAEVVSRTDEEVIIRCNDQLYSAERLLICTGSTNFVPPIPGIEGNEAVWSSTDALESKELPSSVIIVGGGVIGLEFATLYHELGVPVRIIEAMPTLLPNMDHEIVEQLTAHYLKSGLEMHLSTRVQSIEGTCVHTDKGDFEAERILVAVGRRANLQGLEALSDLAFHRGGIQVDDFMKTNLPNVYAAGDVTGKIMLAHVASRQAEVAIGRMLKQLPLQRIAYNAIPSVVYTNPEIAAVGMTEQEVQRFYEEMEGKPAEEVQHLYEVHRLPMAFSGRFVAENEGQNGLCKLIMDTRNRTILGVHCLGNPSSEFIAAASFAVRMGCTVDEFRQVVFPHPTVSEILREAL